MFPKLPGDEGMVYLNFEEQAELLQRLRRVETMLFKMMTAMSIDPREAGFVPKDHDTRGNR